MKKISWRHHYIPQFYLKGFTNQNGTFKIYDVENKHIVKDGKDFYPESYFFEKHGNTIYNDNGPDDFMETKFFKREDNDISILFEKIGKSSKEGRYGLSEEDMPALQFFISVLFWRLPANYDKINYLISQKNLLELGLKIVSKDGQPIDERAIEARIKSSPAFFKMVKYGLPLLTSNQMLDCRTPLTIKSFETPFPSICSDNPLIFINPEIPDIYLDDFIFPLTKDLVLIRGNKINPVLNTVKIEIDMVILKQAKKYVCYTDQKYFDLLNEYFDAHYTNVQQLKEVIFSKLIS